MAPLTGRMMGMKIHLKQGPALSHSFQRQTTSSEKTTKKKRGEFIFLSRRCLNFSIYHLNQQQIEYSKWGVLLFLRVSFDYYLSSKRVKLYLATGSKMRMMSEGLKMEYYDAGWRTREKCSTAENMDRRARCEYQPERESIIIFLAFLDSFRFSPWNISTCIFCFVFSI